MRAAAAQQNPIQGAGVAPAAGVRGALQRDGQPAGRQQAQERAVDLLAHEAPRPTRLVVLELRGAGGRRRHPRRRRRARMG